MTMILDDNVVSRAENDYSRIAQISAVGSLADTVLRELIAFEAGDTDISLVGMPLAAAAFRSASSELDEPHTIWTAPSSAVELLHFSGSGFSTAATPRPFNAESLRPWLDAIVDALEAASAHTATEQEVDLIRREFTQIADGTLRSVSRLATSRYLPV